MKLKEVAYAVYYAFRDTVYKLLYCDKACARALVRPSASATHVRRQKSLARSLRWGENYWCRATLLEKSFWFRDEPMTLNVKSREQIPAHIYRFFFTFYVAVFNRNGYVALKDRHMPSINEK
jgi:hypothetical protein